jgi:hypothetical protein
VLTAFVNTHNSADSKKIGRLSTLQESSLPTLLCREQVASNLSKLTSAFQESHKSPLSEQKILEYENMLSKAQPAETWLILTIVSG